MNSKLFNAISSEKNAKILKRYHRILLTVYILTILAIVITFFSEIVCWCKTVGNIYNLDDLAYRWRVLFSVGFIGLTVYLFFKSLYSLLFCYIFEKYSKKCSLTNKITLLCSFLVILTIVNLGQYSITKYTQKISSDLKTIKMITDDLDKNDIPYRFFVHKIPLIFNKYGFNVENKILGFNDLVFKANDEKRPDLIVTRSKNEHHLFLIHGYKYVKLSEETGLYTNVPQILDNAAKFNLKFGQTYTYERNVDLNYIAKVNRLKIVDNALILSQKKKIDKTNNMQFNPGKYKIEFNFNNIKIWENNLAEDTVIGKIGIHANSKAITIGEQNVTLSDFKANNDSIDNTKANYCCKRYEIELNLPNSYRNVSFSVNLYFDVMLLLDEIKVSKTQ